VTEKNGLCPLCKASVEECPKDRYQFVWAAATHFPSPGMKRLILNQKEARRFLIHYGTGGNWIGEDRYRFNVPLYQ
jgi:hypothetical protein